MKRLLLFSIVVCLGCDMGPPPKPSPPLSRLEKLKRTVEWNDGDLLGRPILEIWEGKRTSVINSNTVEVTDQMGNRREIALDSVDGLAADHPKYAEAIKFLKRFAEEKDSIVAVTEISEKDEVTAIVTAEGAYLNDTVLRYGYGTYKKMNPDLDDELLGAEGAAKYDERGIWGSDEKLNDDTP